MRKEESFHDGLNIWKFFEDNKEVGIMKVSFYQCNANIFSIESYEKGYGTKMVNHLKSMNSLKIIDGDISEGTDQFWLSVGATIEDGEILIKC